MTKIILSQDVPNLGEEGDICLVKDGYARNYLIPQKFAVPYTANYVNMFERKRSAIEKRKAEKRQNAASLKERLEAEEIMLSMPAGDNGKLFGAVTNVTIVDILEKKGISVERKRIEVPEHSIKTVGTFTVRVKLYEKEEAKLKVVVQKAEE
jgi:large subunit ribosomal protein L9